MFGADYFISGVGDLKKDAQMRCHTAWGVELAELDGITKRSDHEELKQFISETADVFRMPYDKTTERWPRRFLFWGTSNGAALRDITGSSRYVCIPVEQMLPLEQVQANRNAIWRRAVLQYEAGENWGDCDQTTRKAISERNDNYSEEDPWLQVVSEYLEDRKESEELPVQVPDLLQALNVPQERRSNQVASRVQRLAAALGWRRDRRMINEKRVMGLWPPATPLPHQCHTAATPSDSSAGSRSGRAATPGTPNREKVEGRGKQGAQQARGALQGSYGQFGVPGVADQAKSLCRNGSGGLERYGSGMAAPASGVAVIGSGADAYADGDDLHWPKRQDVA
jgi:predicted P-loop ATPase